MMPRRLPDGTLVNCTGEQIEDPQPAAQPVDEYEYVEMYEVGRSGSGKTAVYAVHNRHHGDRLGTVSWHAQWRQYTFSPADLTVYSAGCLQDIASFTQQATSAQRAGRLRPWKAA